MGHVIVTARSLGWLLLSLGALLAVLGALLSPRWIVAPPGDANSDSLGLSMRCRVMSGAATPTADNSSAWWSWRRPHCGPLPTGVAPGSWTAALVLLGGGVFLASLAALAGLLACCVHAICGKSILGVCGVVQAAAGVLYLVSLFLFGGGLGASRVQRLCGPDASPFYLDSCSLGWATYAAAGGTALTLLAAVLSVPADRAAGSDKVQDRIFQGHTLVCIA